MDKPTFADALNLSWRAYERLRFRDIRSDDAIRAFVAIVALAGRQARVDRPAYERACEEARIKLNKASRERPELGIMKLATGDPTFKEPHWSNAAGYMAAPPNGDAAPGTFKAALGYMKARGGIRALSRLSAAHRTGMTAPPVDLAEFCGAQLEDIPGEPLDKMDLADGYSIVLVKSEGGRSIGWFQNDDAGVRRAAVATRKRENLVNPTRPLRRPEKSQEADHVLEAAEVNVADPQGRSSIDQPEPIPTVAGDNGVRSHGDIDPRTSAVEAKLVKGGQSGAMGRTRPVQASTHKMVRAPFAVVRPADCPLRGRIGCPSRKLCRNKDQCLESQRRSRTVTTRLAAE